ncbi:MAG: hypothetical protein JNM11_10880 [Chitinimonas sp.]|nr:hypothetical protein [Chitinimonas sp.]
MRTQNTIEFSGSRRVRELPAIRYPEQAAAWAQDGNGYTAWSRGLVELDHPERFVHTASHTLLETISLTFNSCMFIQTGESLSYGAFTCTIAAAGFNHVPACQLLPQ